MALEEAAFILAAVQAIPTPAVWSAEGYPPHGIRYFSTSLMAGQFRSQKGHTLPPHQQWNVLRPVRLRPPSLFPLPPAESFQHIEIHLLRKAHQVHGCPHFSSHGIHITEGIGRSNLAKQIGIFPPWAEKNPASAPWPNLPSADTPPHHHCCHIPPANGILCAGNLIQYPAQCPRSQFGGTSAPSAKYNCSIFPPASLSATQSHRQLYIYTLYTLFPAAAFHDASSLHQISNLLTLVSF